MSYERQLPAPGHGGVDFETRVDFDRLREYRLGRARQALERTFSVGSATPAQRDAYTQARHWMDAAITS